MAARGSTEWTIPVLLLTDAETGARVSVNTLWITRFVEVQGNTAIHMTSGQTVLVREPFDDVNKMFRRGVR